MHKHIRRWGQVFLKNKDIQKRIAQYINSLDYERIIEIGPGAGAITQFIDSSNKEFILVEIDKKLCSYLESRYIEARIIQGNFLEIPIDLFGKEKFLIFGNLPYYITSLIILRFLKEDIFSEAVFMIQKECFESLSSKESEKNYSSFSVLLQSLTTFSKVMDVGRFNFYPTPKVDSVVVHFKKKDTELRDFVEKYAGFLRKCFFMSRKTLSNNFKKFLDSESIFEIFRENDIPSNIRPDAVSVKKYEQIFLSNSAKKCIHGIL